MSLFELSVVPTPGLFCGLWFLLFFFLMRTMVSVLSYHYSKYLICYMALALLQPHHSSDT